MAKRKLRSASPTYSAFLNPVIVALEQVGSREIEAETARRKSEGGPVIPVHGYPVVDPPEHLVQAAAEAARFHHSPPSSGLQELREALAKAIEAQYGYQADPDEQILVTCGAMHGLYLTMTALLSPNDEVLLISPCYFFGGLIKVAGARPVFVEMDEARGYALDFDKIRESISDRTRVIVISSPVNPTGYVYSCEEIEEFVQIAEEYDLLLISDESYDRMVYDGRRHVSPMDFDEGRERTVLVKSFTKSYALPMLRVGYVAAAPELIRQLRKVLEWMMLHGPGLTQHVALAALQGPQEWLVKIFADFETRRNQFMAGLERIPALSCLKPQGGPFAFLNVSRVSDDSAQFAEHLLEHYGIPSVGGPAFQVSGRVRIPFGGTEAAVKKLIEALGDAAAKGTARSGD